MAVTTRESQQMRRPWYRPSLTIQIMIGLVVGGLIGWLRPDWGNAVYFLRDIFINLIKSIIAPLVFSTIVVGIAGAGSVAKSGTDGRESAHLFRDRHDCRALHWTGRSQFHEAGRRRNSRRHQHDVIKTIEQTSSKDSGRNDRPCVSRRA